jgi:hypothetical protein
LAVQAETDPTAEQKEFIMKYSWIIRIVGVVILLAGIAVVGYLAYSAGLAQGQTTAPAAAEADAVTTGRSPWDWRPFHGWAFFPGLLCLAPFFLCLLVFLPLRMVFGPHRMRMPMHGRWHRFWFDDEIPAPVAEWHRRMHEADKGSE